MRWGCESTEGNGFGVSMVQGGTSLRALYVERGGEDGWGCERQSSGKDVFSSTLLPVPGQLWGWTPWWVLVPLLLTPTGGFGDFSRALLQGLADNSHISDLRLDLSNCEVRGQHPWVPSVQPGGPIAVVEGACSLCGKVCALSAVGLG